MANSGQGGGSALLSPPSPCRLPVERWGGKVSSPPSSPKKVFQLSHSSSVCQPSPGGRWVPWAGEQQLGLQAVLSSLLLHFCAFDLLRSTSADQALVRVRLASRVWWQGEETGRDLKQMGLSPLARLPNPRERDWRPNCACLPQCLQSRQVS